MFFSVMTKNFNWEISSKSLVTFKRYDGVNDKKNLILWEFTEKPDFWGVGWGGARDEGRGGDWCFFWGGEVLRH